MVKTLPPMQETKVRYLGQEDPLEKEMADLGSIPRLGRSPGKGKDYPFQFSSLENSMDYIVHGVTKSQK